MSGTFFLVILYIEFNLTERGKCKKINDGFGDFFYKLLNNVFYGKTLENVRNRQEIKITTTKKITIILRKSIIISRKNRI